jgi:arylsulfatase A-like enzyme
MDIAPTLIDLIGIKPRHHHFRGVSLFAAKPQQPIYLIQPYNGIYLGVIYGGRWKYVHHLGTGRDYLYDLESDPRERKNVAEEVDPAFEEQLSDLLHMIYLNQKLIETDRVWNSEAATEEPSARRPPRWKWD